MKLTDEQLSAVLSAAADAHWSGCACLGCIIQGIPDTGLTPPQIAACFGLDQDGAEALRALEARGLA